VKMSRCGSSPQKLHGAMRRSTRGAAWDPVRGACAAPPSNSFSAGERTPFGPRYFRRASTVLLMTNMTKIWRGVIPAITTPFDEAFEIDLVFFGEHCQWLIDNGCSGIVALGSLGEAATLSLGEKHDLLKTAVSAVGERAPIIAGVSALTTREAVEIARIAQGVGCQGLMVLPPYVYAGDWREMKAHVSAVIGATSLSVMLYNNPVAYTTDFLPDQVAELIAEHSNLHAIKESSADVRRVTALRAVAGDGFEILCGVDDMIVEAATIGASGWIAGLVNAFPRESVEVFQTRDWELYKWFLPLLRMDTVPKFVQLIKLVQQEVGMGNERVRPPRLTLVGAEREQALATIHAALAIRGMVASSVLSPSGFSREGPGTSHDR